MPRGRHYRTAQCAISLPAARPGLRSFAPVLRIVFPALCRYGPPLFPLPPRPHYNVNERTGGICINRGNFRNVITRCAVRAIGNIYVRYCGYVRPLKKPRTSVLPFLIFAVCYRGSFVESFAKGVSRRFERSRGGVAQSRASSRRN